MGSNEQKYVFLPVGVIRGRVRLNVGPSGIVSLKYTVLL